MGSKIKIKNIRGTKDILPDESYKWQQVEKTVRKIFEAYNYKEIRTPIFEETELFARGIGQFTDIVTKEMYTFTDKGGTSLTLKPEMTASVMRAYLQYELHKKYPIYKVYYISPMFRQERPQAGRLRQFHQIGAEIIGSANPEADAEIIDLSVKIVEVFSIKNYALKINSVGCEKCRPKYKIILKEFLFKHYDELSEESKKRLEINPLRILDSKDERDKEVIKSAPLIHNYLCSACSEHFEQLKSYLQALQIKYEVDGHLVRGLDYYTRTAFEIICKDLGSQDAIAGGGRYDLLSKEISDEIVPGVGFAAGIERILLVLEKQNYKFAEDKKPFVFIAPLGEKAKNIAFKIAKDIRSQLIPCEIDLLNRSLKSQLREADRQGSSYAVIIGENELSENICILRNMQTGEQQKIGIEKITEVLSNKYAEEISANTTQN